MGGSAEYSGGLTCAQTIDRGVWAALARDNSDSDACLAACLAVLREDRLIDLRDFAFNLAAVSTIPAGAGLCDSSAQVIATIILLRDHFEIAGQLDLTRIVELAYRAQTRISREAVSKASLIAIAAGSSTGLLKVDAQSHQPQGVLQIPQGIRIIGIDTGVRPNPADGQFTRTRTAAFIGQKMILAKMEEMGRAAGKRLVGDPMRGYLANLALDDYKKYFRSALPESLPGSEFLANFAGPLNSGILIDPAIQYQVQSCTDHHVHEPSRVKNFIRFMEQAAALPAQSPQRSAVLDKAGHLMYASHISISRDAQLGALEADLLVDSVRKNERAGLYGAKITDSGQGGSVAVLMNDSEKAIEAINTIVADYQQQTGKPAQIFWNTSAGALETGTRIFNLAD